MQLGIKNSVGRTMCARHFAIDPIIAYKAKFRTGLSRKRNREFIQH